MAAVKKSKKSTRRPTSPDLAHLCDRFISDDPAQLAVYEEHLANAEIARQVHELRTKAGLTQRALAKLIGTTASVICRLEDADYDGHSLSMLQRIAAALDMRIEIRFVSIKRKHSKA